MISKDEQERKYKLGMDYFYGNGVEQSYEKALECFDTVEGLYSPPFEICSSLYKTGKYEIVKKDIEYLLKIDEGNISLNYYILALIPAGCSDLDASMKSFERYVNGITNYDYWLELDGPEVFEKMNIKHDYKEVLTDNELI